MKQVLVEVHDMLSVLSVLGVEKRIGEVGGVESVTVNYAAESATVRYDETRLSIADIRSAAAKMDTSPDGESVIPENLADGRTLQHLRKKGQGWNRAARSDPKAEGRADNKTDEMPVPKARRMNPSSLQPRSPRVSNRQRKKESLKRSRPRAR